MAIIEWKLLHESMVFSSSSLSILVMLELEAYIIFPLCLEENIYLCG